MFIAQNDPFLYNENAWTLLYYCFFKLTKATTGLFGFGIIFVFLPD